jgi:methyl-accepting chemotaxis protein
LKKLINDFGSIILWFLINTAAFYGLFSKWNPIIIVIIITSGGLMAILFSTVLSMKRNAGLREGINFAKAVSRGDLTKQMRAVSKDEAGRLSDELNKMVTNLKFIFNQIRSTLNEIKVLVDRANNTGTLIIQNTHKQSAILENVIIILKNLSAAASFSGGTSVADLIAGTMQSTGNSVESTKAILDNLVALESSSKKLENIAGDFKDIADKTNILSLNVAVDSTKTPDSKHGTENFPIELRKLAERNQTETGNFNDLISETVENVKKVSYNAVDLEQHLKNAEQNIRKIKENISIIEKISSDESSTGERLLKLTENINELNSQSLNQVNGLVNAANTIQNQTDLLNKMLAKYKIEG